MQLTSENYYSQEANREYMSVSGYKDFAGTYGKLPCEFHAMEKLNGNWEDEKTTALLVGSYVGYLLPGEESRGYQVRHRNITERVSVPVYKGN